MGALIGRPVKDCRCAVRWKRAFCARKACSAALGAPDVACTGVVGDAPLKRGMGGCASAVKGVAAAASVAAGVAGDGDGTGGAAGTGAAAMGAGGAAGASADGSAGGA